MKLIVLQGLPGSGKTTWRKKYVEENPATIVVCRDEIRHELGDYSHNSDTEKEVSRIEIERVKNALNDGLDVIIDATNLSMKNMKMWDGIAKQFGIAAQFEMMPYIPMAEALRRDSAPDRDHHCGLEVIMRFYHDHYPDKFFEEKNAMEKHKHVFIHHDRIPINNALPKAVICDIDGTLGWMNRNPFDYARVDEDRLDERMMQILRAMDAAGVEIIIMSGREGTDVCMEKTTKWLDSVMGGIKYTLYLKAAKDYRPDNVTKKEMFEKNIRDKYDVICVYEDREKVVTMWRELGLLCCQVATGC